MPYYCFILLVELRFALQGGEVARKLRLEFPGAIYHVINRGNYRTWVFKEEKTKAAFEGCDVC